jgi:hypothetical protein
MLTEEFLPLLTKRGLKTDRYGVLGWPAARPPYGRLLAAQAP